MRRSVFLLLLLAAVVWTAGAEVLFFDPSTENDASEGFVFGPFDSLLNPSRFNEIQNTMLILDLDGEPFGQPTPFGAVGLRGGIALRTPDGGFSPHFLVVYDANVSDLTAPADATNTDLSYAGYNLGTDTYATIDEEITTLITLQQDGTHSLSALFGLPLGPDAGLALEAAWLHNRRNETVLTSGNQYINVLTIDGATPTTVLPRTEVTRNLIIGQSGYGFELEFGLVNDTFREDASLGVGLWNLVGPNDGQTTVATTYGGGADPTLPDQTTTTELLGSYSGTSAVPRFAVGDYSPPSLSSVILLEADTLTTFPLGEDFFLEVLVDGQLGLHPTQTATDRQTIVMVDDAANPALETNRDVTTTSTVLESPTDIVVQAGAMVRRTLRFGDNAALHLGAGVVPNLTLYSHTITQTEVARQQADGDGDGVYTTVGVDTDTTVTRSGLMSNYSQTVAGAQVRLPVAVTWSPLPGLTFHAGTTTFFTFDVTTESGSTTQGIPAYGNYTQEETVDNLDANNNVALEPISGSDGTVVPFARTTTAFDFFVSGSFGFTLELAAGLTVSAIAEAGRVAFEQFSLTVAAELP